jgi:hypothetical protein
MQTKKIFLASSSELKEDRRDFEIAICRKNKDWVRQGVFLELVIWEDFLDALSKTRLQDEYNKEIRGCDVFVMLFCTKVGRYTEEEFETAVGQFQATSKPFIFTYFKDAGSNDESLLGFQEKLKSLGHFYTVYENTEALQLHFTQQLDKLVANGFIELKPSQGDPVVPGAVTHHATLSGSGAIAQGPGAVAVGAGGVHVGGNSTGNINTGTQIDAGGGTIVFGNVAASGDFVGRDRYSSVTQGVAARDLEPLFASLLAVVAQRATANTQAAAVQQVQELKTEVAKGKQAEDRKIAKIVDGLVAMVPGAVGSVVSMFATPLLGGIAGPVTKYVLDKLNPS